METFLSVLPIVLFRVFFCKWKLSLKLGGSPFLKTNYIPASGHQFFQLFRRFFKLEAAFPDSGNVFFNIFHPTSGNGFSAWWKHYILVSAISLLLETIIGIRRKQFWEKELILARGQLIFWLEENILFSIFRRPLPVFFPSSGKVFFKDILIFGWWKRILELMMASTSRKKVVNKIILFPIDKNSDSTSQNEGFVKKIRFHYAEKLLSPAEISQKTRKNWFQIVGERLLYKKWLHLAQH